MRPVSKRNRTVRLGRRQRLGRRSTSNIVGLLRAELPCMCGAGWRSANYRHLEESVHRGDQSW